MCQLENGSEKNSNFLLRHFWPTLRFLRPLKEQGPEIDLYNTWCSGGPWVSSGGIPDTVRVPLSVEPP